MNKPGAKPEHPDPSVEEAYTFWHDVGKDLIRTSFRSIDEGAKQIIGATAILEGLYFNAIAFSNLQGKISVVWPLVIYLLPIGLLLVSLGAALMVFLPNRYSLNFLSSNATKLIYETIARRKLRSLRVASCFLVFGVTALFLAVLIYLRRLANS